MKKFVKVMSLAMMILMVMMLATACGISNNPDKVKENLEDEGYTVHKMEMDDVTTLTAIKGLDYTNMVAIAFYESTEDAKEAYEEAKEDYEDLDDDIKDDYKVGRSGKVVWMGHKDAIKAAK